MSKCQLFLGSLYLTTPSSSDEWLGFCGDSEIWNRIPYTPIGVPFPMSFRCNIRIFEV